MSTGKHIAGIVVGIFVVGFAQGLFAQGSLTPPGAPAPTMKTLDQIEPRTPIGSLPFTISNSGSYYLTTNLTGATSQPAIQILADNVTLDLGGFSLTGAPGSGDGIAIPGTQNNVTLRNGILAFWGGNGAASYSSGSEGIVMEGLSASSNSIDGIAVNGGANIINCNSCLNGEDGIDTSGGIISGCTADGNGGYGINEAVGEVAYSGSITRCTANDNLNAGIESEYATVSDCGVAENAFDGIDVFDGLVSSCTADGNGATGIALRPGKAAGCSVSENMTGISLTAGTVTGCCVNVLQNTSAYGIVVSASKSLGGITLSGNHCMTIEDPKNPAPPAAGIYVSVSGVYVGDNHVAGNFTVGIDVTTLNGADVVVKNDVNGAATDYSVNSGNDLGPVGTAATATSPWANFSH